MPEAYPGLAMRAGLLHCPGAAGESLVACSVARAVRRPRHCPSVNAPPGQRPPTSATSEEPTEVLDTQAMQELVTHLETARRNPKEHLDTGAMDRLLASLVSADKAGSPPSPHSKATRKRGTRALPRAGSPGTLGSVSPPHADSSPSAASGNYIPDATRYEVVQEATYDAPRIFLRERTHAHIPPADHTSRTSAC
jgi:hypothetical protein